MYNFDFIVLFRLTLFCGLVFELIKKKRNSKSIEIWWKKKMIIIANSVWVTIFGPILQKLFFVHSYSRSVNAQKKTCKNSPKDVKKKNNTTKVCFFLNTKTDKQKKLASRNVVWELYREKTRSSFLSRKGHCFLLTQ